MRVLCTGVPGRLLWHACRAQQTDPGARMFGSCTGHFSISGCCAEGRPGGSPARGLGARAGRRAGPGAERSLAPAQGAV